MGRIRDYIKYTLSELENYTNSEESCVKKVISKKMHIDFPPYGLGKVRQTILRILADKRIGFYSADFNGIILDVKKIKFLNKLGAIRFDNPSIHLDIQADFYVFQPKIEATVRGVVKHISGRQIGVVIYRVFNVTIRLSEEIQKRPEINSEVEFKIKNFDLQNVMPYIEGELIAGKTDQTLEAHYDSGVDEDSDVDLDRTEQNMAEAINDEKKAIVNQNFKREESSSSSEEEEDETVTKKFSKLQQNFRLKGYYSSSDEDEEKEPVMHMHELKIKIEKEANDSEVDDTCDYEIPSIKPTPTMEISNISIKLPAPINLPVPIKQIKELNDSDEDVPSENVIAFSQESGTVVSQAEVLISESAKSTSKSDHSLISKKTQSVQKLKQQTPTGDSFKSFTSERRQRFPSISGSSGDEKFPSLQNKLKESSRDAKRAEREIQITTTTKGVQKRKRTYSEQSNDSKKGKKANKDLNLDKVRNISQQSTPVNTRKANKRESPVATISEKSHNKEKKQKKSKKETSVHSLSQIFQEVKKKKLLKDVDNITRISDAPDDSMFSSPMLSSTRYENCK